MKSPLRDLDLDYARRKIVEFLRERSGDKGYVIGLSGGIDSSLTLALAVKAVKDVKGLIMPDTSITPIRDIDDAVFLAERFGIEYRLIDILPFVKEFAKVLPEDKVALGNLRARIRMMLLYYYANHEGRKVLGTGDRSELLIGYFTKYGDGGVDLLPIGCLYKTEVRALAREAGVPEWIVEKKSSPMLWPGHIAEEEIGLEYDVVDRILVLLFDEGLEPEEVKKRLGLSWEVDRVVEMHRKSEHKRRMPPIPEL